MICRILKEKPEPSVNVVTVPKVALVVGHSEDEKGAVSATGMTEYEKWDIFLDHFMSYYYEDKKIEYKVFLRPKKGAKGIEKAYKAAEKWGADALIEFHFNSYNGMAHGCETLCSFDPIDIEFATTIHNFSLEALGSRDRKVKKKNRKDRGGRSTSGLKAANCLVEPFFGDNREDNDNFNNKYGAYMTAIHEACKEHFDL